MDIAISQILQAQKDLYELHKHEWHPRTPENGKNHILYMVEEIGEGIAILKKKGSDAVVQEPAVRAAFLEEMVDVMMNFSSVLLCYGITAEEFSEAFCKKQTKNMGRDYAGEYKELYHG